MHALLASVGTDGDVFPYFGLGARLRARGHRVTLATHEPYRAAAAEHGFAFLPLVSEGETRDFLSNPDIWHPLRGPRFLARWGAGMIGRQYAILAEAAGDRDAVLVASPGVVAARLVQEKLSRPLASIVLQPWMIPSVFAPPVMPAGLTLPRWAPRPLGRLYFRLLDAVGDALVGRSLNALRASLGMAPVRRLFQWWLSPQCVVGLFPNWYGPPQTDWPPQMRLAGFPLYDGRPRGGLSPELLEFCRAGAPPIAFTFGTGMMHGAPLFRAALSACRSLGARGLFLTKHARQAPPSLPPFVRHCEFAPFQELFPLCGAVVHHGGIGTTAQALAAGTPQLILPLAFDQMDNAVRVKRLGVGDWLDHRRRNGFHIAKALGRLRAPGPLERCRTRAMQFSDQDGLEIAAGWIEELASQPG